MDVSYLSKVIRLLEKFICWNLLFIALISPFAFGSVYALVYQGIQLLVFLTLLLHGVRGHLIGSCVDYSERAAGPMIKRPSFCSRYPFTVPFLLWVGLVIVQLIPLPEEFLRLFFKGTYELQTQVLGSHIGWKALSLSPFDTSRALFQVITVSILFYLTVLYSPFHFSPREPEQREKRTSFFQGPTSDSFFNRFLFVVLLVIACEAFYGLAEYLVDSGAHIYFFKRSTPATGASGTFVNQNHFANYLMLFWPLLCSWFILLLRSSRQGQAKTFSSQAYGVFLTIVLMGVVIAVAVSHSRMAIASGFLAVFLLALSFSSDGFSKTAIFLLIVLSCSAVAVLFLMFLDPGFSLFQIRLSSLLKGAETTRYRVWVDSFQIVRDFPLVGTGLETFQFIFQKYSSVPIVLRYTHAHSDWLELLVETGTAGFLLVALTVVWFFAAHLKRLPILDVTERLLGVGILISLFTFLIHSMAEFNFHIPANAYSFALLTGMGVRLWDRAGEKTNESRREAEQFIS